MTTRVFLLHGGMFSTDGIITSVGMKRIAELCSEAKGTVVHESLWGQWADVYRMIVAKRKDRIALIGYSGGGAKATWIANGNLGDANVLSPLPRIDLMVTYDPSPTWSMMDVGKNVLRAYNYYNTMPLMFGLGGGRYKGPNVREVAIRMQHLAVQFSERLHQQTLGYVKELSNGK